MGKTGKPQCDFVVLVSLEQDCLDRYCLEALNKAVLDGLCAHASRISDYGACTSRKSLSKLNRFFLMSDKSSVTI